MKTTVRTWVIALLFSILPITFAVFISHAAYGVYAEKPANTVSSNEVAMSLTEAYQKGLDEGKALGHNLTIIREVPAHEHRDITSVDERAALAVINKMCSKMTGHKGHHTEPSHKTIECQTTYYREYDYVRYNVFGKEKP